MFAQLLYISYPLAKGKIGSKIQMLNSETFKELEAKFIYITLMHHNLVKTEQKEVKSEYTFLKIDVIYDHQIKRRLQPHFTMKLSSKGCNLLRHTLTFFLIHFLCG